MTDSNRTVLRRVVAGAIAGGIAVGVVKIASAHSGQAVIRCADPTSPTPELVLSITTNPDFGGTSATFSPWILVNGQLVQVIPPSFTAAVHNKVVDPIADFRVPVPGGVVLDTTGSSIPFVNPNSPTDPHPFSSSLPLPVYRGVCGVAPPPPPSPAPPPVVTPAMPEPVMPNISEPAPAPTTPAKPKAKPRTRVHLRPPVLLRSVTQPKPRRCAPGHVRVVIYAWVGKAPRRHIVPVHANCVGRVPAPPVAG